MMIARTFFLFAALLSSVVSVPGQVSAPAQPLNDALIRLARANNWIILATLRAPIPTVKPIARGSSELLAVAQELRRELPAYRITVASNRTLLVEARSAVLPFSGRLQEYYMPPNLGQLKLSLPNTLLAARQPKTGVGGLGSGLASSVDLAVPLKAERLHDITGNEILAHAGAELNGLASILVLEGNSKSKVNDSSFRNWELVAGPRLVAYPGEPPKEVERATGPAFPAVKRQRPD